MRAKEILLRHNENMEQYLAASIATTFSIIVTSKLKRSHIQTMLNDLAAAGNMTQLISDAIKAGDNTTAEGLLNIPRENWLNVLEGNPSECSECSNTSTGTVNTVYKDKNNALESILNMLENNIKGKK